ncbi:MAG TPA: DUF3050 domain-containing protein [Gammaproteobacteria bacterium]|nr:DUF3050 domain-containing protein [Gammaproteobacteria bacterium]
MHTKLLQIIAAISPLADAIKRHKLLTAIDSIEKLRLFTQIHVYAVWDFMALLKALQGKLTSMQPLWTPPINPMGCHLINTLLSEEESDHLPDGRYLSHFALYLEAMSHCGANIQPITGFISDIKADKPLSSLLARTDLPVPARRFIADTFTIIEKNSHAIAASLAFAREYITSNLFSTLLRTIEPTGSHYSLETLKCYLQRHIDLDSDKHSQQSQQLVASLCGTDEIKWQEALDAAHFSLQSRIQLLDGIHAAITHL